MTPRRLGILSLFLVALNIFAQQPTAPPASATDTRSLPAATSAKAAPTAASQAAPDPGLAPVQPAAPNPTTPSASVELRNLEVQFQKALDDNKREIDSLRRQLAQLSAPVGGTNEQLQQLLSRINLLERLNQQRQTNVRRLDQIRYETGKNILNVLIDKSSTLKVTSGLGTALSGFQATLNPTTDATFRSNVAALTTKVERGNAVILDSLNKSGLLSNPYVSLAVTIGSAFFTRSEPAEKIRQIRDVVCVSEFSARTAADAQFIDNSIRTLDQRVRAFNEATKDRFRAYVETVNYRHTWDQYQEQKIASGEDPVTVLTISFFSNLPATSPEDPIPPSLSRLRYQVENVKTYVTEYESLLREINDFYASFAEIVQKDASSAVASDPQSLCKDNTSVGRIQADLLKILPTVKQNKTDFEKAYMTSIPPESRRVLFQSE